MDNFAKVEKHNDLLRDLRTNAIINTNSSGLKKAKELKLKQHREQQRLDKMNKDINSLKSDMGDIKNLLQELLERG